MPLNGVVASSRIDLELLESEDRCGRASAVIRDSFRSLRAGKRHDLLGVTAALLEGDDGSAAGIPTHLRVEVVQGRVRGDVDYQRPGRFRSRRASRLEQVVARLREREAVVRNCGVTESGTGVWFDLGRA
jgi:hypothetical protein